jgi:hypothetical protein
MLERQTFTPAPIDVRALILAAATMPRAAVEASIEGLIALLDLADGDADSEDVDDDTCVDDRGEDDRDNDREGVTLVEQIGQGSALLAYADDDREEDADDRMIRVRYRDRIRARRCVPVRDAYWPFQINGRTPRAPFGREAAAVQPAAR